VSDRWLYAWGLASIGLGGASLIVPLYAVELGGGPITLGILAAAAAGTFSTPSNSAVESIPIVIAANAAIWFAFAAATPVRTLLAVVGTPEDEWSDRIARLNQ